MADRHARQAAVRTPATSANLGPGFDALGLCLGVFDDLAATTTPSGLAVQVSGEGADQVPTDERHLVVRSLRAALDVMGIDQPGLSLVTDNHIPHGRGLGSSAAAIVAGIMLAHGLYPEQGLSLEDRLGLAADLEGHPDNVAACLLGGLTITWTDAGGVHATRLEIADRIRAHVLVPDQSLSTELARAALPGEVPHGDAAANSARSALLVAALTRDPGLLLAGTEDRLHQRYRESTMPQTIALIGALRDTGLAAVVSGAGPTVLVLDTDEHRDFGAVLPAGWSGFDVAIQTRGCFVIDLQAH